MTERTWSSALFRPVDVSSLAAFRALLGAVMFVGTVRFVAQGWVRAHYVEPALTFHYFGFGWVERPPEWALYALHVALAVLALLVAVGFLYRVAIVLWLLGFTYVQLLDVTNYLNHYYFVVLSSALLVFLPAHRAFSVDAHLWPSVRADTMPAWMLYLVRFQVGVVYVFAGLAKLTEDWLIHAQPLGIWMASRTDTPVIGPLLDEPWTAYLLSWAGFLFDTTIVLWLSWRRTRPFAYAVVLVFHALTFVFFDIGMFPFIMVVAATVFFAPDWPRRLSWLRERAASGGAVSAPRWGAAVAAAWCLVQLAVPLRSHLYPGDVLWAEEGMRFSWRVMVREKNGSVTFHVRDRATGRTWQVNPFEYLTMRQAQEMSAQPDLILQMAHVVADDFRSRGLDVEVRAEAWVSLNGRAPRLLIDPDVDLARVEDGLLPAKWILPGPEEPPLPAGGARRASLVASSRER